MILNLARVQSRQAGSSTRAIILLRAMLIDTTIHQDVLIKQALTAGVVSLALLTASVQVEPSRIGDLIVEQAWARATIPSAKAGAVYLTVRNGGSQPDRIVSLEAPVAGHAMAHETRQDGDVSRMSEAGPLSVPP